MPLQSDEELRDLLRRTHHIAVLGAKHDVEADAYKVPLALQRSGYRISAINPKLERWEGALAYPDLASLPEPVDLVDVFRASQHLPSHVDEILGLSWRPQAVWMQLEVRDDACAARLEAAGIAVVQDLCIWREYRRLIAA